MGCWIFSSSSVISLLRSVISLERSVMFSFCLLAMFFSIFSSCPRRMCSWSCRNCRSLSNSKSSFCRSFSMVFWEQNAATKVLSWCNDFGVERGHLVNLEHLPGSLLLLAGKTGCLHLGRGEEILHPACLDKGLEKGWGWKSKGHGQLLHKQPLSSLQLGPHTLFWKEEAPNHVWGRYLSSTADLRWFFFLTLDM